MNKLIISLALIVSGTIGAASPVLFGEPLLTANIGVLAACVGVLILFLCEEDSKKKRIDA